jgi:hypothetical protein
MKPLPTLLLCILGAATGAGLGWLLRGAPAHAEAPVGPATTTQTESSTARKSGFSPAAKSAAASASDELGADLARQAGAMRWRYLLGAADKASAADMPRLIRAARGMPGALRMLAVRWAELDCRHMFETLRAASIKYRAGGDAGLAADHDLPHILFEEWVKKDREAAIAALNDPGSLRQAQSLRYSLVNTVMKSDPARGLKLMTDWNITGFLPDTKAISTWAERNPREAAEAVAANPLAPRDAMKRVGKVWAATDPAAALAFAAETRGLAGVHLASSVMTEWARRDLDAAIAHVSAQTDSLVLTRLGIPLVEAWATTDPQTALLWANENLRGEARASAAASVVKTMAANDIRGAAEFIAGLDPGGPRNRAITQLIDIWIGDDMYNKNNGANAAAALAWMATLPEAEARQQAANSSWRLMYYAPEETIAFLTGPQGHTASQELFDRAAAHLAKQNPESAMQWADALPPERRDAAKHSVLSEWMNSRPEAAMDWVRALPIGEQRAQSIRAATMSLSWQSIDNTRRWLESLPAADHEAARSGLKSNSSLSGDNLATLEAVLR